MNTRDICSKCGHQERCDEECHALFLLEDLVDSITSDIVDGATRIQKALKTGNW